MILIQNPTEISFFEKDAYGRNTRNVVHWEVVQSADDSKNTSATMANLISNSLRATPEVVLIGEAREPEEFQQIQRAMRTGHKTLGTFHAEDAKDAIDDLKLTQRELRQELSDNIANQYDGYVARIEQKQSYLENPSRYSDISDFIKVPNTDCYAMYGNGMTTLGVETVSYVDDDLNYMSTTIIDDFDNYPNNILPMFICVDYWYDENHFLMSANSSNTDGINDLHPIVLKMDTDMNILKTLSLERIDTTDYVSQFRSMAYVNQEKIYISTFWQNMSYFDLLFYSIH